jgi:hypothetical protein
MVVNPPARGDLNMRFFEAMACGAVVVTPRLGNGLNEIAQRDVHYLETEFDRPDMVALFVHENVGRPDLGEMGEGARALVESGHTYHHRVSQINDTLRRTQAVAPIREMSSRDRAWHLARLAESYGDSRYAIRALYQGKGLDPGLAWISSRAVAKSVKRWLGSWLISE